MNKPEIQSELSKNTNPSPEQVAEWKAKHGKIRKITVTEDDEEEMHFYCKKLSLEALKLATRSLTSGDNFKYSEIVLKEVLLNGWDLLSDSEVFLALASKVDSIVTSKTASIIKN